MESSFSPPRNGCKRRPVRLSVRALMLLTLIVGGGLGWVARRSHLQRRAVAAVRAARGVVSYDWQIKDNTFQKRKGPRGPAWIRRLVGDEPFQFITRVNLMNGRTDEAVMAALASQDRLESLGISYPRLTDQGFATLEGLTGLRELTLYGESVGDAAMVHVGKLVGLTELDLQRTNVGDAGLAHLAGLRHLEYLRLEHTRVSDTGMATLAKMRNLKVVGLSSTKVGDAGLARLHGLPLLNVRIHECPVTPASVASLSRTLPRSAVISGP